MRILPRLLPPASLFPASQRFTPPLSQWKPPITQLARISSGKSRRNSDRCTRSGRIAAAAPRISAMLQMFDPTTFPRLTFPHPRHAESMLTTSSGALVANATSVSPITSGGTPIARATRTPPRTSHSAP